MNPWTVDARIWWVGVGSCLVIGITTLSATSGEAALLWLAVATVGVAAALRWIRKRYRDRGVTRKPSPGKPLTDGGEPEIEMVVAIIRPAKLNAVKQALAAAGAPSLTVTNVSGRGTQPSETGQWRGEEYLVDLHQKVKLECAVPEHMTEVVVNAIQRAAHTGEPGDGKIFVVPVLDACRVSTDERGVEAM